MDFRVVHRDQPDARGRCSSPVLHLREAGGSRTLCAHSCTEGDGWGEILDMHPEDVDALDRCGPCYTTREARRRHEREHGVNRWALVA